MIACIASKGRPKTTTYKLYLAAGIDVLHFVEPQDSESYIGVPKIVIDKNDAGLMYVRQYILDYARCNDLGWIIMSDDDISDFGISIGNKCITKDAGILHEIYEKASKLPFEIVALNYRQHAWSAKKIYSINNAFADVCVIMNTKKITWNYEKSLPLKGDRDFVIKSIKYGNGVLKFNKYFFNTPGIGKGVGGLRDVYDTNKDKEIVKRLYYTYSPYVSPCLNNMGRHDFKFDFGNFCLVNKKICK
jgi:hypothetical protein